MAIITRLSRLFQADFHAVLDRIEDPEQLLKQAIREMEQELSATEVHIKVCTQEQQRLEHRARDLQETIGEVDAELDLSLTMGKEELARGLVKRKLEAQRLLRRLSTKHAENDAALAAQSAQLAENRAALGHLRQKAEVFAEHRPAEGDVLSDGLGWTSCELTVTDDEIELALLREKQARGAS